MSNYIAKASTSEKKFYLYSREINIKDKVILESHPNFGEKIVVDIEDDEVACLDDGSKTHCHNLIKEIGKISEGATWVKDNDEFIEENIEWICDSGDEQHISIWALRHIAKNDGEEFKFPNGGCYAIKGCCGHFH